MAVSFVKSLGTAGSGAGGNLTLTVPAGGVPVGDLICFQGVVSNSATLVVTDTRSNTYTILQNLTATTSWVPYIGTCPVTTALLAGDTITFTYNTGTHKVACADQFSGVDNVVDVTPTATTGTTTAVSIAATTVNPDDLLWAAESSYVSVTTDPAPTLSLTDPVAWTKTNENGSGSGRGETTAYQIVSSAGTYTFAGTLSATPTRWQAGMLVLQATGGGPSWPPAEPDAPTLRLTRSILRSR